MRLPVPASDAGLVTALRAGHPEAARALFERHGTHVRRVLARVLGPDGELLDLVQDVFVAALESIDRIEDPAALRGWLTRTAVFIARGRIRRRARWRFLRFVPFDELPEVEAPAPSSEASQTLRATYSVLDKLPRDERIAFALRYVDGMELTEVAAACAVSVATIKRRLSRARDRFLTAAQDNPVLCEHLATLGGTPWS